MPPTADELWFLKNEEGLRLFVYDDKTGKRWLPGQPYKGNLTAGYGRCLVFRGSKTEAQQLERAKQYANGFNGEIAEKWLLEDYAKAERDVDKIGLPWTSNPAPRRACVLFAFNAGTAPLGKGKIIGDAIRKGDLTAAATGFNEYVHDSSGAVLMGLVRRNTKLTIYFCTGKLPR